MSPVGKAIGAAVLFLVLVNGNMPDNTKFALIIGLIVYVIASRGGAGHGAAHAAGGHH